MSCANAISASINHAKLIATLLQRPERRWQFLFGLLTAFSRYFPRRSSPRELLDLNDHLLADIGLSRQDAGKDSLRSSRTRLTVWHVHR
ncbi:DUF1127 domain-containing protein [Tardiphaga sp. OK246]|uniref:DUF1127 domain-containing protein n=1 Tax=Tardiphaga sp. OK246 TaxID=1855307 RepID=UPI000B791FC2|nr:DUF1127 domain-containing protein [Tardiphaga sp. OK246]